MPCCVRGKLQQLLIPCSTDTNTGFSVCLVFLLLFYVMWIPSHQYLYDGANIFGNNPLLGRDFKKLWFQLNFFLHFDFFAYLKRKATAIYTKKASALAPGKMWGRESRLNKWGYYIISVCIWYIDQYLYKFNLLFSW